jgi:hypothetical protein
MNTDEHRWGGWSANKAFPAMDAGHNAGFVHRAIVIGLIAAKSVCIWVPRWFLARVAIADWPTRGGVVWHGIRKEVG